MNTRLLPLLSLLVATGCTVDASQDVSSTAQTQDLTADTASNAKAAQIEDLKSQILDIAYANYGSRENLINVRASIQPLVDQLAAFRTPTNAIDDLKALEGSWLQVWGDDVEPEPPGGSIQYKQTYQVISSKGYFYNLSDIKFGPFTVKGILRGKYEDKGEYLGIEFTRVGVQLGGLNKNRNLVEYVEAIEAGNERLIGQPGGGQAPNGPVGQQGRLKNLYIDDNFRVSTGFNLRDSKQDIFVLVRTEKPVK